MNGHATRLAVSLALAASLAGCGSRQRPETALSATSAEGRVVRVESLTVAYDVGGVRVIHRPNNANDVVAVNLYLLGGARQITPASAGIEPLLLLASEHGTLQYPKGAVRRARARTGSQIVVDPTADWTMVGFRGIKQEFDSTWAVFADRLMHPTLDSANVAIVRDKLIAEARLRRTTPDARIRLIADSLAFAGHPYALDPSGTERSLAAISANDLRSYLREQLVTSRLLLVIVGNVSAEQVNRAVGATLGTLPVGSYAWTLPSAIATRPTSLALEPRRLPTNYVLGYFHGPLAASEDYPAFRVAVALLSSQLNSAIREERSLSYAAYAPFLERAAPSGGVYASTFAPELVVPLMRQQIQKLRTEMLPQRGVRQFVEQFITDYFAENETNAAQADFLARADLYRGDWRVASRFMQDLRAVGADDVRRVARRYMRNVQFAYLGDSTRVKRRDILAF